jgi:D-arabinose 1-dehydrogenase-like Zn-dependent alcohol dehydrogenase
MGHEYVGVVEEIGSEVKNLKAGDFVVGSLVISDNTCGICQSGFQSKCVHAEFVAATIGTQADKSEDSASRRNSRPHTRTSHP